MVARLFAQSNLNALLGVLIKTMGEIMEDYQCRVVEEKKDLDGKITRLSAFVFSEKFTAVQKEEQERMERQLYVMMDYSRCLKDRIAAF